MKKLVITFALALLLGAMLAFSVSAAEITVTDDGTGNITLGECVIEDIDVEIPQASRGFTFVLDTVKQTAKITKWAYYNDPVLGANLVMPSTVTYEGVTYTVTHFNKIANGSDDGKGATNQGNFCIKNVYIPDTVVDIPEGAFFPSRVLERFYAGSGIVSIGRQAFYEAGFTAGRLYVDDGTGNPIVAEKAGLNPGEIKEFIITSRVLSTIGSSAFNNMEFAKGVTATIHFDSITSIGKMAFGANQYQEQSGHYMNGHGIVLEMMDLRNLPESVAPSDIFDRTDGIKHVILYADQMHYFDLFKNFTRIGSLFEIYGGETQESARMLSYNVFTENLQHYIKANINLQFVFHGYVKANGDKADGVTNPNMYENYVYVNYYFENIEQLNFYVNSVKATTNGATTLARYADYKKGLFSVCTADGKVAEYNCSYTDGAFALVDYTPSDDEAAKVTLPVNKVVEEGNCTPSTFCMVCGAKQTSGVPHAIVTEIVYANGYLQAGAKVTYCTNGCGLSEHVSTGAIFRMLGYSVAEFGNGGIVQGFYVNEEALSVYMEQNPDFKFGVVASTSAVPFDKDGTPVNDKVVYHEMTGGKHNAFEIKLIGLSAYADIPVVACGYVIDGGNVYYLDNGETLEKPIFASYNEKLSK